MTPEQILDCYEEADRRMKLSNGHAYLTILKTRCQYCGRSPKQSGTCSAWFKTFLDNLMTVLVERTGQ